MDLICGQCYGIANAVATYLNRRHPRSLLGTVFYIYANTIWHRGDATTFQVIQTFEHDQSCVNNNLTPLSPGSDDDVAEASNAPGTGCQSNSITANDDPTVEETSQPI